MPRRAKGPRLWLRPARRDARGHITHQATWFIRDAGGYSRSTECVQDDIAGAERALARHIAAKHEAQARRKRPADEIPIADVLSIYKRDVALKRARPVAACARLDQLVAAIGDRYLSEINGGLCRAYAEARGSQSAARRELEDLRAAIGHAYKEGICSIKPAIALPDRPPSRERWLTRSEAARLLWAAWRFREEQHGHRTDRASRQHLARFILVALYTGTRAGAVCGASFIPSPTRGRIDTTRGIFYRRPQSRAETNKRQPTIPISPRLLPHLRRWELRGDVAPVTWYGRPVLRISKAFRRLAIDAGMPDVTPHTLRHTAATWLMQSGTDLWEAAGYLGMSTLTLTRVYGHHHPDHLKRASEAIGRRIGGGSSGGGICGEACGGQRQRR